MHLNNPLRRLMLMLTVFIATAVAHAQEGRTLFFPCASCHGEDAAGNPVKSAPNLTGLDETYFFRQMRRFKDGSRQSHLNAQQMALMAPLYATPERLPKLFNYLDSLPLKYAPTLISGDPATGNDLYASYCASCHGLNANGNPSIGAPRLRGMSDWHLISRYKDFRRAKSARSGDIFTSSMAITAQARPLSNQSLADIAMYLNSGAEG